MGDIRTLGASAALFLLGAVQGLFSALLATSGQRGLIIAVGGAVLVGLGGRWGLQSRLGAVWPGVGWFVAVFVLAQQPHPGALLLPGGHQEPGQLVSHMILGGSLTWLLMVVLDRAFISRVTRPMTSLWRRT